MYFLLLPLLGRIETKCCTLNAKTKKRQLLYSRLPFPSPCRRGVRGEVFNGGCNLLFPLTFTTQNHLP